MDFSVNPTHQDVEEFFRINPHLLEKSHLITVTRMYQELLDEHSTCHERRPTAGVALHDHAAKEVGVD